MTAPARRSATYQDVLDAPEHQVAELIDGDLFLQPRPASPHANVASVLGMVLGPPFHLGRGGPGGWVLLDEPELHLGPDVLVPDLAGWRRQTSPDLDLTQASISTVPDWICEVLSPSTMGKDRVKKLPKYGAAGVRHAWLIDPLVRTLEVFAWQNGRWSLALTHEGDGAVEAEPFDALAVELGDLWLPSGDAPP
ncbi:MAG: Uma2 family endonuclease [Myxococcota bacterium]